MPLRNIYGKQGAETQVKSGDHIFVEDTSASIITTSSIVDHRGNIIFEDVGELKAAGRSLEDLRNEINNLMRQTTKLQNTFQVHIIVSPHKKHW